MQFEPDDESDESNIDLPYFEDADSSMGIEGHGTNKSISQLKSEVREALGRLGGEVTSIRKGIFESHGGREGYLIRFRFKGHKGKIPVPGLPIKNKETDKKKARVLKQTLYIARNTLQAHYNIKLLSPESSPLLPYLVARDDDTFGELFREHEAVPGYEKQRGQESRILTNREE